MMDFFLAPFRSPFMQHAFIAGIAVAAVCAVIGVFVVQRGLAFIGDGLAHACFGGIALGLYLHASDQKVLWIAMGFTTTIALGIGFVLRRTQLRGDVATGVFFAFSFALGIVLLHLRTAHDKQIDIEAILFGNILTVNPDVLITMLIVAGVALLGMAVMWSRLAYAIFDAELAAISGVPVALLEYLLLIQTAVVVVVSVKTVGVVLVSSFIVIPAATSRLIASSLARATAVALLIGVAGATLGLIVSYQLNLPTGATIILLHCTCFAIALFVARLRR
jgi:zinc transport system permease protein